MKKITFNDKYGLTKAVIDGNKRQMRKLINLKIFSKNEFEEKIADKIFFSSDTNEYLFKCNNIVYNLPKTNLPKYKVNEVIAIAQKYSDANILSEWNKLMNESPYNNGWKNKNYVKASLMPYNIQIKNIIIQRIQDISDKECILEGIIKGKQGNKDVYYIPNKVMAYNTPKEAYSVLVNKLYGKNTWEKNYWVYVYDFDLINNYNELSKKPTNFSHDNISK